MAKKHVFKRKEQYVDWNKRITDKPFLSGTIFFFAISMPFLPKNMTNPSVEFHFRGISSPISTLAKVLFPVLHGPPQNNQK